MKWGPNLAHANLVRAEMLLRNDEEKHPHKAQEAVEQKQPSRQLKVGSLKSRKWAFKTMNTEH